MSYSDLSYFFLNDALQIQVAMIKKKVVTHQKLRQDGVPVCSSFIISFRCHCFRDRVFLKC